MGRVMLLREAGWRYSNLVTFHGDAVFHCLIELCTILGFLRQVAEGNVQVSCCLHANTVASTDNGESDICIGRSLQHGCAGSTTYLLFLDGDKLYGSA